jgi:hypothetical protein
MSLRPGLLWLTLNLALIIQCLSWNNIFFFFNFTYPLRCVRVPQVEYHWSKSRYWRKDRGKHKSDGKTRMMTYVGSGWPQWNQRILVIERGSTRSHPVENSLWKRLRTCRKTDCRMNEWMNRYNLSVNLYLEDLGADGKIIRKGVKRKQMSSVGLC